MATRKRRDGYSFERLPSGRWRAVVWDPYRQKKGKTRTFDADPERPDQAPDAAHPWAKRAKLNLYLAYKANGIEIEQRPVEAPTFAEYANEWIVSGPTSSQHTAHSHARLLAKVWPTERLADITPVMIKAMLDDMEARGLAKSTRSTRLSMLRKLMTDAVAAGLRPDNPAAGIRGPKVPKDAGRHRNITDDELSRILKIVVSHVSILFTSGHDRRHDAAGEGNTDSGGSFHHVAA